ncbi:hypothetical protein OAE81_00365 [bacterium]|nr:hypothetical protein [bacterium]
MAQIAGNKGAANNRYQVLAWNLLFVLCEVALYPGGLDIQIYLTIGFYGFILYQTSVNLTRGIGYFVTFTLLSLNQSNYLFHSVLPPSFFGLRVLGVSAHSLFTIVLTLLVVYKTGLSNIGNSLRGDFPTFTIWFIIYGFVFGGILVMSGENYLDNYEKDLKTYLPVLFYFIIVKPLSRDDYYHIIKNCIIAVCFLYLVSFSFGKSRQYVEGIDSSLTCTFASTIILLIFSLRSFFSLKIAILIFLVQLGLHSTGFVTLGGKSFIYLITFLIWYGYHKKNTMAVVPISILLLVVPTLLHVLGSYFSDNVIGGKAAQVQLLFSDIRLSALGDHRSSIGNIAGESLTLIDNCLNDLSYLFFGRGFGGGLSDSLGYLNYWAGNHGYNTIDVVRNSYHKMHVAFLEVFIKFGLVGWIFYLRLVLRAFRNSGFSAVLYGIFFLLMFCVSKEYILLVVVFWGSLENPIKQRLA